MTDRKLKPLAALEAKARQVMLMVGLGFVAYTGGTVLSVLLMNRLNHRLVAADNRLLDLVVIILVGQLWLLLVLPALVHLVARILDLPIWRTVILAALTGTLFETAIRFVSTGIEHTFADPMKNGVWAGALISGVLLAVWGGKQGRAWADARQRLAEQEAIGRKAQYDLFLAESTALADRREAARSVAEPSAATQDDTPSKPPT